MSMPYVLPVNIESYKVTKEELRELKLKSNESNAPLFLLFRDKDIESNRLTEECGTLVDADYLPEGYADSCVHFDNEASGKEVCVYWVSPSGMNSDTTNWRSFDDIYP